MEQPEKLIKRLKQLENNIYLLPPLTSINESRDQGLVNSVEKCVKLLKERSSHFKKNANVVRQVNFAFKELGWLAQKVETLDLTIGLEKN